MSAPWDYEGMAVKSTKPKRLALEPRIPRMFRLTEKERLLIEEASSVDNELFSPWVRRVALEEAKKVLARKKG